MYEDLNSWHPLFDPFFVGKSRMNFIEAVDVDPPLPAIDASNEDAKALATYLIQETLSNPTVTLQDIYEFVLSRDISSQALIPKKVDLTFHHTSPLTFGQTPWILHIETVNSLFHPFLIQGKLSGVKLHEQAVYWLVRALLERDDFRTLSTHMHMTETSVHSIFKSDIISSKVRYIPLGVSFSEEQWRRIDESISQKHEMNDPVEILFTNSWHRQPINFFNRGGQEVLFAFIQLQKKFKNAHLTLLSCIPEDFQRTDLFKKAERHPNITIIDRGVSDEELFEMLINATIFLLPSAGFHSISLLRAMGYGAVCVVSDVPGYSEFIEHNRNGLVINGIKDRVYTTDHDTGWLQENYGTMHMLNLNIAESLVKNLILLCDNAGLRGKLALNAMNDVRKKHNGSKFREAFGTLVSEAAKRSDQIEPYKALVKFFDIKPASPDFDRIRKRSEKVRLIREMNGFNIVRAGARFIAVAKSLGEVDLLKDKFGEKEIKPIILLGNSEEEIRKRVKSLNLILWKLIWGMASLFRKVLSPFIWEKQKKTGKFTSDSIKGGRRV